MSTQAGTLPNKTETVTPAASKEGHVKLSWREKICYGFGDFGNGFMFDLGQAYLTKYWIDVCTIPAAAVAGIFAFTKIFDAFMDPIAGSVIDGRKNIGPRGKFRPVMMASAVLLAILTVITFTMYRRRARYSLPMVLTWPGALFTRLLTSLILPWPVS